MKTWPDLFWEATLHYLNGIRNKPFCLLNWEWKEISWWQKDLSWYFRTENEILENPLDKELFDNILTWKSLLDVWCATFPYYRIISSKTENFEGIDVSPLLIEVAEARWFYGARILNIMNWYKTKSWEEKKFDTITLVSNTISIWWDLEWTRKYLQILKNILKPEWKILANVDKFENWDYYVCEFRCKYGEEISQPFNWIRLNLVFLWKLLNELWLILKILCEDSNGYCLEIKYKS
jgi:SAM-dependent methyltransferase